MRRSYTRFTGFADDGWMDGLVSAAAVIGSDGAVVLGVVVAEEVEEDGALTLGAAWISL